MMFPAKSSKNFHSNKFHNQTPGSPPVIQAKAIMKVSEQKTNWLAVKAGVTSEWDSCDFVLVELTADYVQTLKERVAVARSMALAVDFSNLVFWGSPDGWFVYDFDDGEDEGSRTIGLDDELELAASCFVEFENEEEIEKIGRPEQRIDIQQLEVYPDGSARFVGAGKNTDEQFWSAHFSIDEL
jgi:hypothetical protein